jgi:hypothetical protein
MNLALKKGKSLEDSLRDQTVQLEEVKDIQHTGVFADAVREHKDFIDYMMNEWYPSHQGDLSRFPKEERDYRIHPVETVLNPKEINAFLAMIQNTGEDLQVPLIFFRSLIQKSYDSGHNDFDLGEVDLSRNRDFGGYLEGSEDKPLIVRASGEIGNALGAETKHVEFYMRGNIGDSGAWDSQDSKFFIDGKAKSGFGSHCKDCYLEVGETSLIPTFSDSERSTYRILEGYPSGRDSYNIGLRSRDCIVISPNKKLVKIMAKDFRIEDGYNETRGFFKRDIGVKGNRFFHELGDKTLVEVFS